MSVTSPAFTFTDPAEPQVLSAARLLAAKLSSNDPISRSDLNAVLCEHFGGSDAEGRWSVREAHAALELAQVLYVQGVADLTTAMSSECADQAFTRLETLVPGQTSRSDEQIEWQQFATPPRIAWLAARTCGLVPGELVLEPSAGTGMLAVWAAKAGTRLALNEISPLRRECLGSLFPAAPVTGFDSELIDELLGSQVAPSVVLMNPPYSHGIERGHDGRTGARHLRSAWKRLLPGGRLVAVMPEWFDLPRFLNGIAGPVTLRLNAAIERGFIKHGTSITTRLLVLDKVDHGDMPVIAKPVSFAELCSLVDGLPSRMQVTDEPVIAAKALVPLRLVAPGRKPSPLQVRSVAAPPAIKPLAYQPLEAPAPIAQQVGHYLPYRPSRIAIEGALDHPTPLVESIAMGSITAPVPVAVPQLPSNLIATGMLSAAQAETLIYAASAHSRDLAGRFEPEDKGCALKASADGRAYRMGYFLGDGTGAGKGRQVAAVILDRWVRGERRHIWISKNEALLEDARRDWTALGGLPIDVQPLGQWKLGIPVTMREGILFVTYPTLRSGRSDATRLEQILDWAGDDFDGVIVFDEAHAMANAAGGEGSRGKVKGSEQGIAGVRLQNLLPRARVLYASARRQGRVSRIHRRKPRGRPMPERTAKANAAKSTVRARVEHVFAQQKAKMGLFIRTIRTIGIKRAKAKITLANLAYNMHRLIFHERRAAKG